jgi:hypothetical protein
MVAEPGYMQTSDGTCYRIYYLTRSNWLRCSQFMSALLSIDIDFYRSIYDGKPLLLWFCYYVSLLLLVLEFARADDALKSRNLVRDTWGTRSVRNEPVRRHKDRRPSILSRDKLFSSCLVARTLLDKDTKLLNKSADEIVFYGRILGYLNYRHYQNNIEWVITNFS